MYKWKIILAKKPKEIREESSIINKATTSIKTIIDTFKKSSEHELNNIGLPVIDNTYYTQDVLKMKKKYRIQCLKKIKKK